MSFAGRVLSIKSNVDCFLVEKSLSKLPTLRQMITMKKEEFWSQEAKGTREKKVIAVLQDDGTDERRNGG